MWFNYIFLVLTSCLVLSINGKQSDTTNTNEPKSKLIKFPDNDDSTNDDNPQPINPSQAIIAIQIINSTAVEMKTGSNKKRTIETSLGYGSYQGNNFYYKTQDGKFEIYPYSQHDIPGQNHGKSSPGLQSNVDIQQAYSFIVGKKQQQQQQPQNYYYPKQYQPEYMKQHHPSGYSGYQQQQPQGQTTLFSTINQGQISGLSPHIPTQFVQYPVTPQGATQQLQIPVIVLRVYSDQLSHSNEIYPNLPASNPYASLVNMINLQQLLNGYMSENIAYTNPHTQGPQVSQSHPQVSIPSRHNYEHSSPQYAEQQLQYELPISENYPKSTHTQVILKPKKQYYKSPKAMGVSVTTPTGFSYKALSAPHQPQQQTQYVYQNEAENQQQYIPGTEQGYVAQGNQYSVPVVGAQNYYQHPQAYVSQPAGQHHDAASYSSAENQQQSVYQMPQTSQEYNEYIRQISAQYAADPSAQYAADPSAQYVADPSVQYATDPSAQYAQMAEKPNEKDQTQYIYINEAELSNHGYVYKNPSTGEYMYYPSAAGSQHPSAMDQTKYSLPDPTSQQHHHHQSSTASAAAYSYTTPSAKAVTEKSASKHYNYHAQNPRHAIHSSSSEEEPRAMTSSVGRAKKNKSSGPLVYAPPK